LKPPTRLFFLINMGVSCEISCKPIQFLFRCSKPSWTLVSSKNSSTQWTSMCARAAVTCRQCHVQISHGPLQVTSTYNTVYGMYNPI
jgi:hypothetical protein